MAAARTTTPPPPVIGKAGSYTVFITPPPAPTPSESPRSPIASPAPSAIGSSPEKGSPLPAKAPPSPPPVQVPPQQFEKSAAKASGSVFGFFWDAVVKVQAAHSSLDEYLADWFGLDHSKYQWALNDYYESNGKEKESSKISNPKELVNKVQAV